MSERSRTLAKQIIAHAARIRDLSERPLDPAVSAELRALATAIQTKLTEHDGLGCFATD